MRSDRHAPVAIVGGGFSGTAVAAQLARRGIRSLLVEQSGRHGLGAAYSTEAPEHLLNVRASAMSAWPDNSDDFSQYAASVGGHPQDFAERRLFGGYLSHLLEDAIAAGAEPVTGRVTSARPEGGRWRLTLSDGTQYEADAVVLATGNQAPQALRAFGNVIDRIIDNPWAPPARDAIKAAAANTSDVLIVGTGLTMVDVVLSLDAAGHRGRIVAVSRRGLIPRGHGEPATASIEAHDIPHGNLGTLLRWLRRRSAEVGWRAAVDSLRPYSHDLWQALRTEQQQRFLRHARPWWDVHRHRVAPEIADRLRQLVEQGRLQVVAGRIVRALEVDGDVEVRIAKRGKDQTDAIRFQHIFNCTGPLGAMEQTGDSMLGQLLREGFARSDPLGIGLDVDHQSRVAGAPRLWALGPLTKGKFWEIVAVPDIRVQAQQVADDIAEELGR